MYLLQGVGVVRRMPVGTHRGQHDQPPESRGRRWAVLAVLSAAQFLTVLDLWVVNIALPALQHELAPASLSDVSWILDAYAIVLAALLLPAGRAADGIGRRGCFLAGLAVFGAASLGCALAPGLWVLIAFRVLQAAGAAMLMPTSLGLALSVFPPRQRGTAVGVWAGVGALAAGSGPVVGGLLVASSWRWIFVLPSMLLWGIANALIQPLLFASADAAPRALLASGSAVLAMGRQLGSAVGVAVLVAVLGHSPGAGLAGFDRAWIVVLITAAMTAAAGLRAGRRPGRTGWYLVRVPAAGLELASGPDDRQAFHRVPVPAPPGRYTAMGTASQAGGLGGCPVRPRRPCPLPCC